MRFELANQGSATLLLLEISISALRTARLGKEATTCEVDKRHLVGHLSLVCLVKHMLP